MISMALGAVIGFAIIQVMVWFVKKSTSQYRSRLDSGATIRRTPDGSIHIQAGNGTKRKGGHQGPSKSDIEKLSVEEPKQDLATRLKTNLLD